MNKIDVAKGQLGVQEEPKGSNSGPEVDMYLKSVGLSKGFSWCMAFVYWCTLSANSQTHLIKTGGVLAQYNQIEAQYKHSTPLAGDIFIMDFGKGLGHTGFVTEVTGDSIKTIEGNSNDEGSREGYEVCEKVRKISSCKGFIRI